MSKTGEELITIYILPNIWRIRDNQAMQLGELIKYSVRNIFLQKSCRNSGMETSSRPICFLKKLSIKKTL